MSSCGVPPTSAAPALTTPVTAPTIATDTAAPGSPPVPSPAPASDPDAVSAVAASATAMRSITAAHVRYATHGFDDLTATSWAADVTVSPPAAVGSANLLVNGERVATDFDVADGRLRVEGVDRVLRDAGESRGLLDPPALLDPITGLTAVLSSVTEPVTDPVPAELNERPMLKVRGRIPAASATLLIPPGSLGEATEVPVSLWLDPAAGHTLRQLIATVDGRSVTCAIDPVTG